MATDWKIFLKIIKNQPLAILQNNITEAVVWWLSYKMDIFVLIRQKTWPPVGEAHFSLYVYSKFFKNFLFYTRWTQSGKIILDQVYVKLPPFILNTTFDYATQVWDVRDVWVSIR